MDTCPSAAAARTLPAELEERGSAWLPIGDALRAKPDLTLSLGGDAVVVTMGP